jgi:hypothetical protein
VLFLPKRSKSFKFAPKSYEGVLLGYDSNSRAYHVFNVTTGCVEITFDAVFDETNEFQKEEVDLDLVGDEEAPCDTLQKMTIDDVRIQDGFKPYKQPPPRFNLDIYDHVKEEVNVTPKIPKFGM